MINLPSKFATENAKADKTPVVIVKLLDSELENEQTTQAHWAANSAESNVDYTPAPPSAGDVILSSQAESYTAKLNDTQRYDFASVIVGNYMYSIGGVIAIVAPKAALITWRRYDITANTWAAMPDLALQRCGHTLVSDGSNLLYLTGGRSTRDLDTAGVLHQDHQSYNITTGVWTALAAPPVRIFDSAAGYLNGKIYLAGGRTDNGFGLTTLSVYDVAGDTWATLAALPRKFDRHTMVVWPDGGVSGQLVIYGGFNTDTATVSDEVWIYDRETDHWSQSISGATARIGHAATIINDRMFIIGGKLMSAGYMADLWEFSLTNKTWIERTAGSHVYARLTAVADGSKIYTYGGRDGGQTYFDTYEYQAAIFQPTGFITTQTADMGAVPTVNGELVLKDIRPAGTDIVYEAWRSATGAFGGEEFYMGIVIDGQIIPSGGWAQYYRVKATLSSDAGGLNSPTVQSIKAAFATYLSYADTVGLGYEPAVINVSSLMTTIDTFKKSSIGQVTVKLAFIKTLSDYLTNKYPKNKIVKILVGFRAAGWAEVDFIDYFWGQIDDWAISNQDEVSITLKDYKKEWKADVPSKWESVLDDVTWTTAHPVDVILDILQNRINIRDSKIDISSFDTLRSTLAGWVVTRTITKNPEQADALIHELMVLMSAFFIPKGDGKISLKRFDPLEASVKNFSDVDGLNKVWSANAGSLINEVLVYSDNDGLGSGVNNYADLRIGLDVTSSVNYDEVAPKEIRDNWTQQKAHDFFTNGDFETGNTTGWTLGLAGTAAATASAVAAAPPFKGSWKGEVLITNIGAAVDDITLQQTGLSITKDHVYKITFGVTSDVNYTLQVKFRRTANPFLSYTDEAVKSVNVTAGYAVYEVKYTANVTAADAAVFFLIGFGPATVNIDEVRIVDMELEQTDDLISKILTRYATPPELITINTDASTIALEVGDIVNYSSVRAPSADMTGVQNLKMQIVNKNLNFKKNTNKLKLLRV